jgi:hypothetical protein
VRALEGRGASRDVQCARRRGRADAGAKRASVASVKNIERAIRDREGFDVAIRADGMNLRKLPPYDYGRAARAAFTVADWKRKRFASNYPGLDVDVLRADGRVAPRTMSLARLRDEYAQ